MKHWLSLGLVVAIGCAADTTSPLDDSGSASQSELKQMARHNEQSGVSYAETGFPVELLKLDRSSIDFTVMPSWDCGGTDPAPVREIYVCKTQGVGDQEKRISRCYAVQPDIEVNDPYLQCSRGATDFECTQNILSNGRYHVGALYSSDQCGTYDFWWSGVQFTERDLSAALQSINQSRHLDHRMFQTLEQQEIIGNGRWILKRSSLRLDFAVTDPVTSEHISIVGVGLEDVAYDESLDADSVIPPCVPAMFTSDIEAGSIEPPPPSYTTWSCPIVPGLPIKVDVNLYPPHIEPQAFWLEVSLAGVAAPGPHERVRFDGIAPKDAIYSPFISR